MRFHVRVRRRHYASPAADSLKRQLSRITYLRYKRSFNRTIVQLRDTFISGGIEDGKPWSIGEFIFSIRNIHYRKLVITIPSLPGPNNGAIMHQPECRPASPSHLARRCLLCTLVTSQCTLMDQSALRRHQSELRAPASEV